jgi:hypothetical protein
VIWGFLNGLTVLVWTMATAKQPPQNRSGWKRLSKTLLTFGIICLTWIFFRAATLPDAVHILKTILADAFRPSAYAAYGAQMPVPSAVWAHLLGAIAIEWLQRPHPHPLFLKAWPKALRWVVYTLFVIDILIFGTLHQGSFIYFQF